MGLFDFLKRKRSPPPSEPAALDVATVPPDVRWDAEVRERCAQAFVARLRQLEAIPRWVAVNGSHRRFEWRGRIWWTTDQGLQGVVLDELVGLALCGLHRDPDWGPEERKVQTAGYIVMHDATPREALQAIRLADEALIWVATAREQAAAAKRAEAEAAALAERRMLAEQADDVRELTGLLVRDTLRGEG